MSQEFLLGMNAKVYQGPSGTDLATLTEMSNVKDVTLNLEAGEADVTTRANSISQSLYDMAKVGKVTKTGRLRAATYQLP